MNIPGRYIQRANLGDLPPEHAGLRNERDIRQAINIPPPGNAAGYNPITPDGGGQMMVGENQSSWGSISFTVSDVEAIKIQDFLLRKFMLIQNNSAMGTLFVGFGWIPTANNSMVLEPGTGFEPYRYPINDIWVLASAPNTDGILIFGT